MPTGKGFTPIIGLAVVVALAMAAVFGAMSLTPSPVAAQTALEATATGAAMSIEVEWDFIDGLAGKDIEARWKEPDESFSQGSWTDATSGDLAFMPGKAGVKDKLTVSGLTDGRMYNVQVRFTHDSVEMQTDLLSATPSSPPVGSFSSLAAEGGEGFVKLTWVWNNAGSSLTGWQYRSRISARAVSAGVSAQDQGDWGDWMDIPGGGSVDEYSIVDIEPGVEYDFQVRPLVGDKALADSELPKPVTATADLGPLPPMEPTFEAGSDSPGKNTRYDLTVQLDGGRMNTLTDELVIELEDYDVPGSISVNSIAITVNEGGSTQDRTTIPEDVSISGEKIFITIGDLNKDRTGGSGTSDGETADFGINDTGVIHVVIRQSAGVSNPTEAKTYGPVVEVESVSAGTKILDLDFSKEDDDGNKMYPKLRQTVPWILDLDEEDGGLGTVVTATGKGFKDKTTLTVFVDKPQIVMWDPDPSDSDDRMVRLQSSAAAIADYVPAQGNVPLVLTDDDDAALHVYTDATGSYAMSPNRKLDLGEDEVCVDAAISGADIGECEFTVTHPTFDGGVNYLNAVDGRNNYVSLDKDLAEFVLEASVSASPAGGSPGEIILVQVVDFPGGPIGQIEISRRNYCPSPEVPICPGSVDSTGSGNFKVEIPDWVKAGVQELRVTSGTNDDVDASINISLVGPQISVTPESILANQRISLVGTGFSPNSEIDDDVEHALVTIGGDPVSWGRINEGDQVDVDSGGNWSASIDLPLSEATTAEGERAIRVTDSGGRTGVVLVTVPSRTVTITPELGRVGTIAVVRGTGFPSKNDEGSSFNVEIEYDAGNEKTTTVSAVPDTSGRFEVQLRIPTTASIPSNNTVKVTFEDEDDVAVVTTVAHEVPEGIITLSTTSGGPGSTVTVNGEGFKSFVPVSLVKVGTLDVTPAPKPSTDGNGMMSFSVTIPGLDTGIQTIEVNVGRTTSSTGFTVTESGVNPGDIKEVAVGLEPLGDNFVSIWHFNNDTKMWSFYTPALEEGNSLTHVITGETYLIRIKSTTEVILNNDTRNLTCVGDNCWNQLVW